jgi:hypothetical protein
VDPIGKRIRIGGLERPENKWLEIVGVVADVHYSGADKAAEPALYTPFRQNEWQSTYLVLRARGDPNALVAPVRELIGTLDSGLAVIDIRTMRERFDEAIGAPRFRSLLFTAFGVLGLLLAAIGLYAVTATIVAERTREIGVRMALGARARNVVSGIVAGAVRTAAAGLAVGGHHRVAGHATAARTAVRTESPSTRLRTPRQRRYCSALRCWPPGCRQGAQRRRIQCGRCTRDNASGSKRSRRDFRRNLTQNFWRGQAIDGWRVGATERQRTS